MSVTATTLFPPGCLKTEDKAPFWVLGGKRAPQKYFWGKIRGTPGETTRGLPPPDISPPEPPGFFKGGLEVPSPLVKRTRGVSPRTLGFW